MTDSEFLVAHYRRIADMTEANAKRCPKQGPTLCAHAALMREFADDVSAPGIDNAGIVAALLKACRAAQALGDL